MLQFVTKPGSDVIISATTAASELDIESLWILDGASDPEFDPMGDADSRGTGNPAGADSDASGLGRAGLPEAIVSDAMQEELDFIDPAIRSLIEQALRSGAPDFVAGFETDDGTPLEAAWTGPRVAVVPHSGVAAPTGWIVRSVDEWTLNELLSTIQERN